jgi:hypothetical protein
MYICMYVCVCVCVYADVRPPAAGRKDAQGPEDCPQEGNLPGANVAGTQTSPFPDGTPTPADHLRKVCGRVCMCVCVRVRVCV